MLYQLHTTCLWPDFQIRKWRWCWCSYRWQGCHIGDRISSLFFGIWKREINTVTWIKKKRKVSAYVVLQKLAFPSFWLCCKFTCATTKFVQIVQNIHSSALLIQFHARSFQILVTNQHQTYIHSSPIWTSVLSIRLQLTAGWWTASKVKYTAWFCRYQIKEWHSWELRQSPLWGIPTLTKCIFKE